MNPRDKVLRRAVPALRPRTSRDDHDVLAAMCHDCLLRPDPTTAFEPIISHMLRTFGVVATRAEIAAIFDSAKPIEFDQMRAWSRGATTYAVLRNFLSFHRVRFRATNTPAFREFSRLALPFLHR